MEIPPEPGGKQCRSLSTLPEPEKEPSAFQVYDSSPVSLMQLSEAVLARGARRQIKRKLRMGGFMVRG